MSMQKPMILCVDDEKAVLDSLWDQITPVLGNEFICDLCESGSEALQLIDEYQANDQQLAVIISDMLMPGMKGDELLTRVHQKLPQTLKILLTGQTSFESVKNAINQARLYRYISKPWEEEDFVLTVTEAARSYQQYLLLIEHNRILRSLNQATQEISGMMDAENLVRKLLSYVMENTGAEACYLVSEHGNQLQVQNHASRKNALQVPLENSQKSSVLQHVNNFIESGSAPLYNLMAPIRKNGRNLGYLFLENSDTQDPFNDNHREVVQMLASQAAISLENARLVSTLASRTEELEDEKEKVGVIMTELVQKNAEVEEANRIVEEKNQDMLDSIQYAKRIQESILPKHDSLSEFFPQSFVYYKPRDIVSGDFYWWAVQDNCIVVAVCDCTGHGVPGALMSMMGVNLLNQIVNEYRILEPDVILNYLHLRMIQSLNKHEQGNSNDGMDCALICYERGSSELSFSGACRPLYMLREGQLIQHEPTRLSIADASEHRKSNNFNIVRIPLQAGDQFFLFSDGIVDQFGGTHMRKYSPRRLRELLLESADLPSQAQHQVIQSSVAQWQGNHRQTDDMLLIGLKYQP